MRSESNQQCLPRGNGFTVRCRTRHICNSPKLWRRQLVTIQHVPTYEIGRNTCSSANSGADEGNRTPVLSLEGCDNTIILHPQKVAEPHVLSSTSSGIPTSVVRTTLRIQIELWCPQRDSNSQPTVYKTVALPLCYTGKLVLPDGPDPST